MSKTKVVTVAVAGFMLAFSAGHFDINGSVAFLGGMLWAVTCHLIGYMEANT